MKGGSERFSSLTRFRRFSSVKAHLPEALTKSEAWAAFVSVSSPVLAVEKSAAALGGVCWGHGLPMKFG